MPNRPKEPPSLQAQALAVLRTRYSAHWHFMVQRALGFDADERRRRTKELRRCAYGGHWTAFPRTAPLVRRYMGEICFLPLLQRHEWLDESIIHQRYCARHWHELYDDTILMFTYTDWDAPAPQHCMINCTLDQVKRKSFIDGEEYEFGPGKSFWLTHQAAGARKRARSPSRSEERARAPQT